MLTAILKSPQLMDSRSSMESPATTPPAMPDPVLALRESLEHEIKAQLQAEFDARMNQAREEAQAQGYKDGLTEGHKEGMASALETFSKKQTLLEKAIEQTEQSAKDWFDTLEARATQLAKEAFCQLLGESTLDVGLIQRLVQRMVNGLRDHEILSIRLHPTECNLMRQALRANGDADNKQALHTRLREDSSIRAGGVVVETPRGELHATLEVLLRKLITIVEEQRQQIDKNDAAVVHALRA